MKIQLTAIRRCTPTLVFSLAAACGNATAPDDAGLGSARAAVAALEQRDEATVGVCAAAAARCSVDAPDAGDTACARLTDVCSRLTERLSEVRDPAVSCWRGIEACLQNAPPGTPCPSAEQCEAIDDEVEIERDPVVQCGERVQACLSRAAQVAESGAACDAIAASCERIGSGEDDGEDEEEQAEVEEDGEESAEAAAAGRGRGEAARAAAGVPEAGASAAAPSED